jgi:ELWxxDGT repeat protein
MAKQLVLFDGTDSAGNQGLWVTNGIAAGTSELISGVSPYGLTSFNGEVLFYSNDGLWVTKGTAATTFQLTGINGANTSGVFDVLIPNLVIFNSEVMFNGSDAAGDTSLWVTNGTAAGTSELTGISGASTNGLDVQGMVVLGGEVLFDGFDAAGVDGLWVTNGTGAGTHELTGISGTDSSGLFLGGAGYIYPDFAVFNSEVVFTGYDAAGNLGLWVSNGTATGTHEVTGITAGFVSPDGLPNPTDFTTYNSEVLFAAGSGGNGSQSGGLWVTNGTTAGTSELGGSNNTGISGAYPIGLFYGSAIASTFDPDLTVFNGKVLFEGLDSGTHYGLWVTNGTAAGTTEIGGLGNTGISGAYTNIGGLAPTGFNVFNGEVFFEGRDTAGNEGLWVTNGTAAGTHELTGISGASSSGIGPSDLTSVTLINALAAPDDFTDNGISDVLLRADANGDTGFYAISNGANAGWKDIGASSTAYTVVGTGDFYDTGTTDILFRANATGDTGFYEIVNGAKMAWVDVGASSTAYSVVGVGDFTGNGTDDILYRGNSTGDTGFYQIVNGANTGWHDIGASSTAYSVVGVGDFTGSGTDDILYRNNTTGDTGFYQMANGVKTAWVDVGGSSTAYSVVGTGDFLGNGADDILFRDNNTGDTGFYAISNGVATWHDIGASSTAYTVVAIGDYLGTETSDVLFRNNTTGDTGFYAISNGVNTGWHDIGASSTAYHVVS